MFTILCTVRPVLVSQHAMVSARVEQCLQRCAELAVDVLEMESEMAVRCEPDRCGLDDLQEYQDQLEVRVRWTLLQGYQRKILQNLAHGLPYI